MTPCQTARIFTYAYIFASYTLAFLSSIPTGWFIFHSQSAPACLGIWVSLSNLIHAINSTIWRHDVINRAPLWCDLTSKISLIYSTGAICSCVCIAKFLAFAMSPGAESLNYSVKLRWDVGNYVFSIGFPILLVPFSFLYSPHRFALVRTIGCETSYTLTWPTFMFFLIWSPIFGSIATFYTAYVVIRLWKTRKAMAYDGPSHGSKVPLRRLTWLCLMYTTVAFPISLYYTHVLIISGGYVPYRLEAFNGSVRSIKYDPLKRSPAFNDALALIGGLVFVTFFTFSKDMRAIYVRGFQNFRTSIGICLQRLYKRVRSDRRSVSTHTGDLELELTRIPECSINKSLHTKSIGSSNEDRTFASTSDDRTLCSRTPHKLPHPQVSSRSQNQFSVIEFEARERPSFLKAFTDLHPTSR
ncbi:hypothetical protein CROQUDRAFT_66280 [Cronartium quercuum f. sp. fusiforme G11]|uniref:Uncharacterized protein n=1 Tax=Cronartium quercuum f. sp. fusiforme G11 TaxID=708437 RepID=A0A9P6NGR5_9BASI|nr:hypothetical protein CROQUDRAFT_66280 [Cronartium quercuum f. sp. fusiforme G11]